jgi:hypothetical protein
MFRVARTLKLKILAILTKKRTEYIYSLYLKTLQQVNPKMNMFHLDLDNLRTIYKRKKQLSNRDKRK